MDDKIKIPKPVAYALDIMARRLVGSDFLLHPNKNTPHGIGGYYSGLEYNAGIITRYRQENVKKKKLEDLITFTKDCLYMNEIQAGWHVLSRFLEDENVQSMEQEKKAMQHVLDNYSDFVQKLYDYRLWFVGFIDKRESCITKLGETKIISPKPYFPKQSR